MAAINDLIRQIEDKNLRDRLQQEVARLSKQKKFGLVFEDHIPECTPLYGVAVRKGSLVAVKGEDIRDVYFVSAISNGRAAIVNKATGEKSERPLDTLVAVAQFGEPIFPSLIPIDSVENAPDSNLWHTLIEADNFHALQLLEYLYPKQVDCIYIDPPYNSRAKDWKYNTGRKIRGTFYKKAKEAIYPELSKIKMADGFAANAEYFKLGFLDKSSVALGQQFREILPMLWLKAGAVGKRPVLADGELPDMLIPESSNFAVLIDERYFGAFLAEIEARPNIEYVYLVTNSEDAYREMGSRIRTRNVTQLYRDYIDNFVINSRRI